MRASDVAFIEKPAEVSGLAGLFSIYLMAKLRRQAVQYTIQLAVR